MRTRPHRLHLNEMAGEPSHGDTTGRSPAKDCREKPCEAAARPLLSRERVCQGGLSRVCRLVSQIRPWTYLGQVPSPGQGHRLVTRRGQLTPSGVGRAGPAVPSMARPALHARHHLCTHRFLPPGQPLHQPAREYPKEYDPESVIPAAKHAHKEPTPRPLLHPTWDATSPRSRSDSALPAPTPALRAGYPCRRKSGWCL